MFLTKLFHFLFGYVIIDIIGNSGEKFIKDAVGKGITVKNVKEKSDKTTFEISYSDYKTLKKQGFEFDKVQIHGFYYLLERLRKRKGFLMGFLLFITFIITASQFIWTIEYDADCNIAELKKAVELTGLKVGSPKWRLMKPLDMKNVILNHTNDICWCFVYIDGTRATVKVRKNIVPKRITDQKTPCDIVAMRDGIIKRVIAKKGKTLLFENEVVSAGDTVISGTIDFEEQPGYTVHSAGSVLAYTKHIKSGIYKQYYCYKRFSGRKKHFITVNLYKWKIPLYINKNIRYEHFEKEKTSYNSKIGFGIDVVTVLEYDLQKEPISYDTTVEFAKNKLEQEIASELFKSATLIDKKCDVKKLDEETIEVFVTMDFIEDIGTEREIEEVTVVEPKNNKPSGEF